MLRIDARTRRTTALMQLTHFILLLASLAAVLLLLSDPSAVNVICALTLIALTGMMTVCGWD